MEQFNLIRREHFLHGKSIRCISKEHKIHRRLVRQALKSAVPPASKRSFKETVEQWLAPIYEAYVQCASVAVTPRLKV